MIPIRTDDGQLYITEDPVGPGAIHVAGIAYTDEKMHTTTVISATDVYIAGQRVSAVGALVCVDSSPTAFGGFNEGFSNGFDIT